MENEYENEFWINMRAMRPGGGALTERLLGLWELPPGRRILDVACGVGETAAMLVAKGHAAIGVDVSGKLINIGRCLYPDTELMVADAADLPFGPSFFDALIIQCSREIIGALPLHVLKNEGVIYVSDIYVKGTPPDVPEGCELIAWEDASGDLDAFAATLIWNGIKLPDCRKKQRGSIGYYIMAARKNIAEQCRTSY